MCDRIHRIEINFAMPTHWTSDQYRKLHVLLDEVVRAIENQPEDGIHWVSGHGSRPNWSKADAVFLGKPADNNAPETGEPTFDDDIYSIETTARGFVSEKERRRVLRNRADSGIKCPKCGKSNVTKVTGQCPDCKYVLSCLSEQK